MDTSAHTTVDDLISQLPAMAPGQAYINTLNQIAFKLLNIDGAKSLHYANEALLKAEEISYPFGKARALLYLGIQSHEFKKGLEQCREALEIFTQLQNHQYTASALRYITILQMRLGEMESAAITSDRLVEHCHHYNLTDKIGGAYNINATILITKGDYGKALPKMLKALEILEKQGVAGEMAMTYNNLTALYFNLDNNEKALEYAIKCAEKYKEAGLELLHAEAGLIIGQCYAKLNRNDESLKSILYALERAETLHHQKLEAEIYPTLGTLYLAKGNYEIALTNLEKGYLLCSKMQLLQPMVNALLSLGNLYKTPTFNGHNFSKAEGYFLEAYNLANNNGLKWEAREISQSLADMYEHTGNWQQAFVRQKEYMRLDKEMTTSESRNRMAGFEIEKELALTVKEKETTDRILHNILPKQIADRIKTGDEEIIERYEYATVLFADIVGFTQWSRGMPIKELAQHLNRFFQLFDELAAEFQVEKIKTIGDAYMCVAGLPEPCHDHAERIAHMALAMLQKIKEHYPNGEIKLRIGIHTGEAIAGIIGKNKFAYDLWGDTVNTASRMESHGLPDKIQVTEDVMRLLTPKFGFEERGNVDVKGKGPMKTWWLTGVS